MALVLPVFLGIGMVVMGIGNWYVLKKNLQTLVDAGAFAGATGFNACFQDPIGTNLGIAQRALEYAGDPTRDGSTRNLLVEDNRDVHVALNSSQYWSTANGTDPNSPSPGYGLDYSLPALDDLGRPVANSQPCSTRFLDVKATEDRAPQLFKVLPLQPSPKAKARVVIREVEGLNGMLPWGVPEQDPVKVAALVVNEDLAATDSNSVRVAVPLVKQTLASADPLRQWNVWRGDGLRFGVGGSVNFGVVILTSRDPTASLSGSLAQICGQNPVQTHCYAGGTSRSGLSFIHVYNPSSPAVSIGDVQLIGDTCSLDLSRPYFLLNGGCSAQLHAVVNFGVSGDPRGMPTCGSVSSTATGNMVWGPGGIGGALGTWTGTVSLGSGSGRNAIGITANYRNPSRSNCSQPLSVSEPTVAAPYVANDASGPVEYLELRNLNTGLLANSIERDTSNVNIRFTVGLVPPLAVTSTWDEPPIYLRVTTNSSQTQAVDCDDSGVQGPSGNHSNFRNEIQDGCLTFYRVNSRNGSCAGYGTGTLPPPQIVNNPYPDCVITQTGVSSGQIRQALETRFGGNPCKTLNNWPKTAGAPYPDASDPRYVVLFIVDTSSFSGSGNQVYPIRKFGGFYLTGGDGLGCPGDDPPPPGTRQASAWGHFVKIESINPEATPSDQLCAFEQVGVCTAVMVE